MFYWLITVCCLIWSSCLMRTHTCTLRDHNAIWVYVSHPVHVHCTVTFVWTEHSEPVCVCAFVHSNRWSTMHHGTHKKQYKQMYVHTCTCTRTIRHTWTQKKEAKRILGNNHPTRFLSSLAVEWERVNALDACTCVLTSETWRVR